MRSIGYRAAVHRNLVVGGSEIDLLMKDRRTRELIVIEVKSSRLGEHQAMAALNARKRVQDRASRPWTATTWASIAGGEFE